MSRVVTGICGLIILASVIVPVTFIYQERVDADMQSNVDSFAGLIDSFVTSEADSAMIPMDEVLPSQDSYIVIDGHKIILHYDGNTYLALSENVISSTAIELGNDDFLRIVKTPNGIASEAVSF